MDFFRLPPVLPNITDICTIRKDEENSTRCHQNANTGPGYHQRLNGQVCRKSSGNSPCFSFGSSALQSPTIQDECSPPSLIPARESSVLVQHKSVTGRTEQGRFEMVDTAGQKDNRITNPATTTLDANRVRCINQGMGCSTEHSDTNRGCVVGTGSHQSHQLLRAIGGIPSTQILWQDLESYDSSASVGHSARQFCHLQILQKLHVDMKWSLPKCNLRMAQGTQCLHAIGNYMRKVTLKYQHAPLSMHVYLYACFHSYRCLYSKWLISCQLSNSFRFRTLVLLIYCTLLISTSY